MKRFLAASAAAMILLAGCGGGHARPATKTSGHATVAASGQLSYVTPWGVQAHSPTFGLPPTGQATPLLPRAIQTLELFDSVTVSAIPRGAQAVACYLNGRFANCSAMAAAFPHAYRLPITVAAVPIYPSTARRVVLDSERGDAPASSVGPWVRGELGLGVIPEVYANASDMPAVKASIAASGISLSRVPLWLASWTFRPGLFVGYPARQWTDHGPNGENYDESTVTPDFLGIQPAPPLPVCIHKREANSACAAVKAKVASDQRAAASSQRAYVARGCVVLGQRDQWFADRVAHDHSAFGRKRLAYRKGALAATRRVEGRRQCSLFASRVGLFTSLAHQLQLAN